MKHVFILAAWCISLAVSAQRYTPTTQIPATTYSVVAYNTQADSFSVGKLVVRLANIKAREKQNVSFWCRASLAVTYNSDTVFSRFYADVHPAGGCAGFYMQPAVHGSYIFISKFGDYRGRTIAIDTTGKVLDIRGGITYYNPLIDWIVTEHNSDIGGLTVYNTKMGKLVFDSEEPQINGDTCFICGRYLTDVRYDERYLYVVYMSDDENNNQQSGSVRSFRFEHDTQAISLAPVPTAYLDDLPQVEVINDPLANGAVDCNCAIPIK